MGISLSGLTPATTFDGLLKVGDNEPLTADLKAISDGSGNDSAIQLSTGELKVLGQLNVDTDAATNIINLRGDGLNINQIYHANEVTYNSIAMANSSGIQLKNFTAVVASIRNNKFGIGEIAPTSTLHVKGSGDDDTTTSLLVQNSVGADSLKITDNSGLIIGNSTANTTHNINSASSLPLTVSRLGVVRFSVSSDSGNGQIVLKGNTSNEFTVGTNGNNFQINDGANTNQGTKRFSILQDGSTGIGDVTPTARLHVKVAANTDTIARFQDPVTTSSYIDIKNDSTLTDYVGIFWGNRGKIRSKETGPVFIDTLGGVVFVNGNTAKSKIYTDGNMSVGTSVIAADTMLHVKGSGNDATTTALLVQNSAGATGFQVDDGGNIGLGNPPLTGIKVAQTSGAARFRDLYFGNIGSSAINNSSLTSINWNGSTGIGIANSEALAATAMLHVKGSGNDNTTTALLVQNSDGDDMFKVLDSGATRINTGTLSSTIIGLNGTGGGFIVDAGKVNNIRADINGVAINSTTSANTSFKVKGSGTTSATTALLVEDSAGFDLLKVDDGKNIYLNGSAVKMSITGSGLELKAYHTTVLLVDGPQGQARTPSGIPFGVGTSTLNNASAILQADSTTKGFLPPRMTNSEKTSITSPAAGLMVYDTDANQMSYYNGSGWANF